MQNGSSLTITNVGLRHYLEGVNRLILILIEQTSSYNLIYHNYLFPKLIIINNWEPLQQLQPMKPTKISIINLSILLINTQIFHDDTT